MDDKKLIWMPASGRPGTSVIYRIAMTIKKRLIEAKLSEIRINWK